MLPTASSSSATSLKRAWASSPVLRNFFIEKNASQAVELISEALHPVKTHQEIAVEEVVGRVVLPDFSIDKKTQRPQFNRFLLRRSLFKGSALLFH